MKKVRILSLTIALALALTAFAGCTSAGAGTATVAPTVQPSAGAATSQPTVAPTVAPQEKVTLRFSWWGNETRHSATIAAVELWNKNNPNIQIETSPQGWDGYHDKLLTELSAGTAPDLFQISYDSIPDYAAKGQLLDVTSYMGTLFADYDAVLKGLYTVDGKNYGLSTGLNTPCLYYNKTLLDKFGLTAPSDDESWDTLLERAKAATKDTDGDGKVDVWGISDPVGMPFEFIQQLSVQYGIELFAQDGKSSRFDDPAVVAMYKMLSVYTDAGVSPGPGDVTIKEGSSSFLSGYTVYDIGTLSAFAGSASSSADEMSAAAFPVLAGKDEMRYVAGSTPIAVYSKTPHADQALQFLSWFLVSADSAKAQGGMVRGVFPSKAQRDAMAEKASTDRVTGQVMRLANFFGTLKTGGVQPQSPIALEEWSKIYLECYAEYAYKRVTVEQFCQKVKELGDPILAQ